MKKLLIISTLLILFLSCHRDMDTCEACLCFNWIEPLRISYQDHNSNDLLKDDLIHIDSIKGYSLDNTYMTSSELGYLNFDIRKWVADSSDNHEFSFIEILNHRIVDFDSTKEYGIDENHQFYIYYNQNKVDTIDILWNQIISKPGNCCSCIDHPLVYFKCNSEEINEGTPTGAVIIRK